jgi:hypothetical protein
MKHIHKVHLIEVVSPKDKYVLYGRVIEMFHAAPHGVGRSLEPVGIVHRLVRGHNIDEPFGKSIHLVRAAYVLIEGFRIELREDIDPVEPGVEAVAYGNIDEPVFAE